MTVGSLGSHVHVTNAIWGSYLAGQYTLHFANLSYFAGNITNGPLNAPLSASFQGVTPIDSSDFDAYDLRCS